MSTSCRHSAFCKWRHFTFHHSGSSHTVAQFPQASSPVVQIMVPSVAGGLSADGVIGILILFFIRWTSTSGTWCSACELDLEGFVQILLKISHDDGYTYVLDNARHSTLRSW